MQGLHKATRIRYPNSAVINNIVTYHDMYYRHVSHFRLLFRIFAPPLSFEPWGVLERYLDTIFLFAIQEDYINAKMAKSELDCNDV